MAKLTTLGPNPIRPLISNVSVVSSTVTNKRSAANLLPAVNRTETLVKFFNATVDHMFQPEDVEFISGYIGSKPSYYDAAKDFYVPEETKDRTVYQLPVTAVSKNLASGDVQNVMFYDDILNQLGLQGAKIDDPARLFDGEYYSWSPPIDVDKFINFNQYYWLPDGPYTITLLDPTNLIYDAVGKASYTYVGRYQLFNDDTVKDGELVFTSGMRVTVTNDATVELDGSVLIVEGVGRSLIIREDHITQNPSWDTVGWDTRSWDGGDEQMIPDYMTVARCSDDLNRWSVGNRWFHQDVIVSSGMLLADQQGARASRPIIEFERNLRLHRWGTRGRPDVDLVDTATTDIYSRLVGQPSGIVDGTNLIDGMRILVTADINPQVNDRIYVVSGIKDYGRITLTLIEDGGNTDGSPAFGDCTHVTLGQHNANRSFWYDGSAWTGGQAYVKHQPPVFAGFDQDGNSFLDPAIYPGSTFKGTTIFTYATDTATGTDSVLQIRAKRDQFGDLMFSSSSSVADGFSYIENNQSQEYAGYIWYSWLNGDIGNGWYLGRSPTKQYILNSFQIASETSTFMIDQRPPADVPGELPNLAVNLIADGRSTRLRRGRDFSLEGRILTLARPAAPGQRIDIYSWSLGTPSSTNGYYTLPSTLTNNPNNSEPTSVSFNQTFEHFAGMIANQPGEITDGVGDTAWRDSQQIRGLGTQILQHRSPMLKLMMLNSTDINKGMLSGTSPTDPSLVIQWAEREYTRFYNRFIRSLFNLYVNMGYGPGNAPTDWIAAALKQVNLGKTKSSPWAYSGYEQKEDFSATTATPTFVPPTAAKLGLAPVYVPEVYLDTAYSPAKLTLQTHDGARIIMEDPQGQPLGTIDLDLQSTQNPSLLTNPVASAWLRFEQDLYAGVPAAYKTTDSVPAFDRRAYQPGKWRSGDYDRAEFIDISRPSFDKWIIQSQVDYKANVSFQPNNQFSFNYRTCIDKDGQPVPGYWKGIYRWFYDTDRPHSHPWEMLGFSQKPAWWESEYGPKPYTNGNTRLWEDLRDGMIRQGARTGIDACWARPGLMQCIPVDDQGNLLPPLLAGTVVGLPSVADAQAEWIFGDGAPVESAWLHRLEHGYTLALTGYLMKPVRFIEQAWDPLRTVRAGQGDCAQWIATDTNTRRGSHQFYMHRENPLQVGGTLNIPHESNLSFFGSWGVQHWISEYLVSQNLSVTNYIGNIIRGVNGQLAHKFGGFVGTDNSMRVMVDSFGQIGYTSQIIPSESINTHLYRSSSIGTYFYSGVIVIKQRNGWKVVGYDGIYPFFNIIPSMLTGPKSSLVIGNLSVTLYQTGQGLVQIPYGTVFSSRQEVFDFIVSYGRWLESQGWVFDAQNADNTSILDWKQSGKDFVYWSQGNWANGNFVALSPLAGGAKFRKDFGTIQYVNGTIGGTYPVLDKAGQPIDKQNLEILRQDAEIVVRSINPQTIFGLRLFCTTVEHIMLLDNVTQFNDMIYDALYAQYQPRVKIYAYKTNGWNGRLDAPGYFLYQDPTTNEWKLIENFEKTAEDFRLLYNIDQPKNVVAIDNKTAATMRVTNDEHAVTRKDLGDLSKHLIGYQKRDYLQNLLLDETTEFQFYQGFIRQKGTQRSLDSMLRNINIIGSGEQINYYEEYALRKGRYGAVSLNTNIDFILEQSEFGNSPQRIDVFSKFNSDRSTSGVIELVPRDPRIVVPPENYEGKLFPLRAQAGDKAYADMPTAGYVQLGELTHTVVDQDALINLSSDLITQGKVLQTGDTVWQLITPDLSWTAWRVCESNATVTGTTTSDATGQFTSIGFSGAHGIVNGDIIVNSGFGNNDGMNGTFTAQNVTVDSVTIPISTFIQETSGRVQVYRPIRFYTKSDLDNTIILGGWQAGDRAFVDHGEPTTKCEHANPCDCELTNPWTVYRRNQGTWSADRKAIRKVDSELMLSSKIYDKVSLRVLGYMEYFDPAKGIIPGPADREITYKNAIDPAKYNRGDTSVYTLDADAAWAKAHVGEVWWDLSTTRYIDYEQGDIDYRLKNWGKTVPGTSIDIYEWVKSPIPPSDWANYVLEGAALTQLGLAFTASGTVRNSSNPAWTESVEYDNNGNRRTWYYFWVTKSDFKNTIPGRSLSINEITKLITDPGAGGIAWYAALADRSIVVANVYQWLNAANTVMQIIYTTQHNDANDHKQWDLLRKGDAYCVIPDQYWDKLRDSLTGNDGMGNQVPDPHLNPLQRYGNLIRPRQSWFVDRLKALSIWISNVNDLLANATEPLVLDPDKYAWSIYFNQAEPAPNTYDWYAEDMSKLVYIQPQVADGQTVLVAPVAANDNLWTLWAWDQSQGIFVLQRKQSYKVSNYWNYVDWYHPGFSSQSIPTYIVDTANELSQIKLKAGQTAKVLDYGSLGWALFGLVNGEQKLVGLEEGTIQISDALWDTALNRDGWDMVTYDSDRYDYNPYMEIGVIFDGIRQGLFGNGSSIELNHLFFSMINYVLSEQKFVDWIFKTSFMVVSGTNEPLSTSQLYQPSITDSLLDYLNETKPYRSKIRDFISGRSTSDTANMRLMDFDKPPMPDGKILDPNNPADANILSTGSTYTPWWDNYQTNPQLIRQLKTTLVFDRVSSMPQNAVVANADSFGTTVRFTLDGVNSANAFVLGENVLVSGVLPNGAIGFNGPGKVTSRSGNVLVVAYSSNIGIGSGTNGAVYHQSWGAAQRIMHDYQPTQFMPQRFDPDLISGTDYKGRIYTGTDFNLEPGWGVAPWDFAAGWDADAASFDSYLEVIMEGGLPPEYETFVGNGSRTHFRLTKIPQDLKHTTVWRDNVLAVYGTDYTVPNWSDRAEVTDGGSGYAVGDLLELLEDRPGPTTRNIVVQVTAVGASGSIRTVAVTNRGYYPTIQHGSYSTKHVDYTPGTGSGAKIQPIWAGDTLVFDVPPANSDKPNVWILYAGTTFEAAPDGESDEIADGYGFIQPAVEEDHAEELFKVRARDCMRIDTYSQPVGGRPLVIFRSYLTDGRQDHFDLGLRPQNQAAVLVYLDGVMLRHGPSYDYVINFETGEVVFIRPPQAGHNLSMTTFGEGGSGNSIAVAYVAKPGEDYSVGDSIYLEGGVPAHGLLNNRANVIVDTVTASRISVLDGGKGWRPGDVLVLGSDNATVSTSRLALKVDRVSNVNAITAVSVINPGNYSVIPQVTVWNTNGRGSNIIIEPTWGANTVSVSQPGLYASKPEGNFTQHSITGVNPAKIGRGAEFQVQWTSITAQETFLADGVSGTYVMNIEPQSVNRTMVTVGGAMIEPNKISLAGHAVTLQDVPDYGAWVVITLFNTDQFSVAVDNELTADTDPATGNLITRYNLVRAAFDTVPDYSTTVVTVNGRSIPPPITDAAVSNGFSRLLPLTYQPSDLNMLQVYVDGIQQVLGTDYTVHDQQVELTYDAAVDSIVVAIVVDPDYGYYYKLDADAIEFFDTKSLLGFDSIGFDDLFGFDSDEEVIAQSDRISVTNFSQDLSYRFATEQFTGSATGLYQLAGAPTADSTVTVSLGGRLQRMLWDYALVRETVQGFDTAGYELNGFEQGSETRWFIKFNENAMHTDQDTIIVRYMRGKPERPATAFRQFISASGSRTSQVISETGKTLLLANVNINTSEIEVADVNALTLPNQNRPGSIWIDDEKISFNRIVLAPTPSHPHRAFLTDISRGSGGTSQSPSNVYSTGFFDGDGTISTFPIPSALLGVDFTVWVDGDLQIRDQDYTISETDVVMSSAPPSGSRNVRISGQIINSSNITVVHTSGTAVHDGGFVSTIPGGYSWESSPDGLQYSSSHMARFLLEHPGARS